MHLFALDAASPNESGASRCHHCCSDKASPVIVDWFGHDLLHLSRRLNLSPTNANSITQWCEAWPTQWYQAWLPHSDLDHRIADTLV
jgi:hypothetical protein